MLDEKLKANVIKDAVLLKLVGFKPNYTYMVAARKSANGLEK